MTSRNIYEQQSANKRKTVVVMALFALFFGFLGWGFDVYFFRFGRRRTSVSGRDNCRSLLWRLECVVESAKWRLHGPLLFRCNPVDDNDPKYQVLRDVTDEMSIASGLPKPHLYVIPDPDPNAFATGKDPDHACIAVTEGLLEKLDREELQGVIAHEMSHVRNYDIRMMTVVAALVGAVMLLSEVGLRSGRFGFGRRRDSSSRIAAAGR